MCLISFAIHTHPQHHLVLVAHRDEFFKRESSQMHWWDPLSQNGNSVLAGKDEVGGGTWLGIAETGKWAAVTNFREAHPERPDVRTRGELVTDFLSSGDSPEEYLQTVNSKRDQYNGFNLLVSDGNEVYWFSNRDEANPTEFLPLSPGVYGLCNHLLNTAWPKVILAKQKLSSKIEKGEPVEPSRLLNILHDETRPTDNQLPDTGVKLELERLLSSMFINSETMDYGTRCSTAMTITQNSPEPSGKNEKLTISVAEKTYPSQSVVKFSFKTT